MSRLPNLRPNKIIATLKKAGFQEHHQKGGHLYLWHPNRELMTSVPVHPGDLDRNLLKKIIKQAGLTEGAFRKLL